jgi:hypothetical protein
VINVEIEFILAVGSVIEANSAHFDFIACHHWNFLSHRLTVWVAAGREDRAATHIDLP